MGKLDLAGVVDELRRHDTFLLATHAAPDGDAVGSLLTLSYFLEALGKKNICCVCQDSVPKTYQWLPGVDRIAKPSEVTGPFDLAVLIDVGRLVRTGQTASVIPEDQEILVLDHHEEDAPSGKLHFVDVSYASAAEIVVDLFETAGLAMQPDAALCAYVGLATDTGGFRFSNTNPGALRRAAKLLETGIDVFNVSARLFDMISLPKFMLMQRVLERMCVSVEGRYAYSELTLDDMTEANATGEDLDGLVNIGRNIDGIEVSALFRELDSGQVKVSLRSRGAVSCAELLSHFGGGGHKGAAGATLDMPMPKAKEIVLSKLAEVLAAP